MTEYMHDTTGERAGSLPGVMLLAESARKVVGVAGGLAEKVHDNTGLTARDMKEFGNRLREAVEVEVGGENFSLERLRSEPELAPNIKIWKEILNGDESRYEELTLLIPAVARTLAESRRDGLYLDGLTTLDAATATALAGCKAKWLSLDGLTTLDAATAKALAGFEGEIFCQPEIEMLIQNHRPPLLLDFFLLMCHNKPMHS